MVLEKDELSLTVRGFRADKVLPPRGSYSFLAEDHPILDVEIGCGVGFHPLKYSAANPERFLVAIEHSSERFAKFERRIAHHPVRQNLLAVHEDAEAFFVHYFKPQTLDRILILYPNPYPKKVHLNRRWYGMPFAKYMVDCLKLDGQLTLATNEEFYAQEAIKFFTNYWGLGLVENSQLKASENSFAPRTHFEKKYLENGQTCFNLIFKKSA